MHHINEGISVQPTQRITRNQNKKKAQSDDCKSAELFLLYLRWDLKLFLCWCFHVFNYSVEAFHSLFFLFSYFCFFLSQFETFFLLFLSFFFWGSWWWGLRERRQKKFHFSRTRKSLHQVFVSQIAHFYCLALIFHMLPIALHSINTNECCLNRFIDENMLEFSHWKILSFHNFFLL